MSTYDFRAGDAKWQARWRDERRFVTPQDAAKPKYYMLDMFPYPSGAGLHVGHPLGYISTGIVAAYKRMRGYNVLRPMGYDSFGLPAENYAIQTGRHPANTTEENIARYRSQLEMLGLGYDPTTEIRTSDPSYYKWTQWIFLKLFGAWYNKADDRAASIEMLVSIFEREGNGGVQAATGCEVIFDAATWRTMSEAEQQGVLMQYRLAYTSSTYVNWCEALGTVLANEEIKDGLSERGGHPVERRQMRQWSLRITAYAERLLRDLEGLDWPTSLVEMQRHWIGRSEGATIDFEIEGQVEYLAAFTTRPDTLFGSTFMVVAPEHPLVPQLTTPAQQAEVEAYVQYAMARSERDRQAEAKTYTGVFTGAYALHPYTGARMPIWAADYVLVGYGTGAIMAVPGHDGRDYAFARQFGLEIKEVVAGGDISEAAFEAKDGVLVHSDFLDGLRVQEAIGAMIDRLEADGRGKRRVQYRLRDAIFSRQRYWGEPFPIVWRDGTAYPVAELPMTLPDVKSYKSTGTGESPLAAITDWVNLPDGSRRETDTMPGWAGSSWYFFRYTDPENDAAFADPEKIRYWLPVDLYVGGAEHAVGHLLYSRFWTKVLYDLGYVHVKEPFRKLVNQGMIQGRSSIVYKRKDRHAFQSLPLPDDRKNYMPIHVDVNLVQDDVLDVEAYRKWRKDDAAAEYILNEEGKFVCGFEIEKMSKSLHNVVNPDDMCAEYGADAFRMYEMFLGPIEQHKPWSTQGITGVFGFLKRFWTWCADEPLTDEPPTDDELRPLHRAIKKVGDDIEALAFNTCVSQFMICFNELTKLGCRKRAVFEPFCVILAPFAPHLAEELWERFGHATSILAADWPVYDEAYLTDEAFDYPVSINGKKKLNLLLPLDFDAARLEAEVMASERVAKFLEGKTVRKVIAVPGKIINVVVG